MRTTRIDAASRANLRTVSRSDLRRGVDALGYVPATPAAPAPPTSWVYFVQSGDAIKIGYARDPYTRFMNLCTASPTDLHYLGHMAGARAEEQAVHRRFMHLRVRGEWFRATPELLAFVEAHRYDAEA